MISTRFQAVVVVAALIALLAPHGAAAQAPAAPCAMPPLPTASKDANIFTTEQAGILGEIVMQHVLRQFKLVRDPALNAYVQKIADRMAEAAGTGPVRVELLDIPQVNAFTFPGGRILVARKLVAFARTEDELAGVLAHEFGHVVRRDAERSMSMALRRVLNVTAVGDARDIEDKYNRLIDNQARKPSAGRGTSEDEQQGADAIAVWLMARVGYAPKAYADVWDRYHELKANTGNWLSDLFGSTKPEAKRLRVTLKTAASLPASCQGTRSTTEQQFAEWQRSVVEASRATNAASLHGVVSERKIEPPLRSDLAHLKFSPDGRWVLAQDDSSVYVFERDGLKFWSRFDAPDAYGAQFTPDSAAVVFYDPNYRVERWNVASKQREWVHELVVNTGCPQSTLSPDGLWMACITPAFGLRVFDVATGTVGFQKDGFYQFTAWDAYALWLLSFAGPNPPFFQMRFSPDARVLIVARGQDSVAVDLQKRQAFSLPGSIKSRIGRAFDFLGSDRIIGVHWHNPEESAILTFPQGNVVSKVKLDAAVVTAATRGDDYLILAGRAGGILVFNTKTSKVSGSTRTPAFDMYDDVYLSELRTGQIALQKIGDQKPTATATVPTGPLARLRAADVSPDFQTAALSLRSRGVVWNLATGATTLLRGFRGAFVGKNHDVLLDFPRQGQAERAIVRVLANTSNGQPTVAIVAPRPANAPRLDPKTAPTLPEGAATVTAESVQQHGSYLVGFKDGAKKSEPTRLVVFDSNDGREVWARPLGKSSPGAVMASARHNSLVLFWNYASDAAKDIVGEKPAIARQFEGMKAKREDVALFEVVDLDTGRARGDLLVDFGRGSFLPTTVIAARDRVVIGDDENRALAFSLETGRALGRAFGAPLDVSPDARLAALQNAAGEVAIYATEGMQRLDEFVFPSAVVFARFSPDGTRLFALTRDQVSYILELSPAAPATKHD